MENRFSVDPVNIMPGLQMLGESIQEKKATRGAFEVERTKEKKLAKLRDEAVQVMKTGTPEEIQDFRIRHPEVNKAIEGAYKFKNEQTKTNKLESLRRIVIGGEDPVQVEMERADMVGEAGGDYQQTIDNTYGAMSDPKGAYDRALREYSMLASKDEWKQFQESQGGGIGGKPTPDILNYDQAKKGGYEGTFMDFLSEKKAKPDPKTKDIKEFEYGQEHPEFSQGAPGEKFGSEFTEEQRNAMADQYTESGKFEFSGRSEELKKFNADIKKRSLERQKQKGVSSVDTYYATLDKQGMTKDINAQQKKYGSMKSFARNIDKQVSKIDEVGKRLYKFDTKILNAPINTLLTKVVGSPDRAVMQLLIGELSEEIGKLASGATESVAALSEGGREKWDNIFDPNLSYNDMMQLINESKEVAHMRIDSMKETLSESKIIRKGGKIKSKYRSGGGITKAEYNLLPSGATYVQGGKTYRKK